MKKCLCTLLDDSFVSQFETFMKSFIYYNSWFFGPDESIDIVIIDNNLSEEKKKLICSYYNRVKFVPVKYDKYEAVDFSGTHERLQATFYKLEAFRLFDYDRVIFIDMDTVVLGDIKELFDYRSSNFSACKAYRKNQDLITEGINSGVFVLNKSVLDKSIYNRLLEMARNKQISMPDQKVINNYFKRRISYIPKQYNVEKRMVYTDTYYTTFINTKILHYVGTKPNTPDKEKNDDEQKYRELEKVWWLFESMSYEDILKGKRIDFDPIKYMKKCYKEFIR